MGFTVQKVYIARGITHNHMAPQYLNDEHYIDALQSLGGEATTAELADEIDRDQSVVRRRLKDTDGVECIRIGNSLLYKINDEEDG